MLKIDDLRGKTDDELVVEITQQKKALFNLRFQKSSGQLENTAEMRRVRRSVARIETIMTERSKGLKIVKTAAPKKTAKKPAAKKTETKKAEAKKTEAKKPAAKKAASKTPAKKPAAKKET